MKNKFVALTVKKGWMDLDVFADWALHALGNQSKILKGCLTNDDLQLLIPRWSPAADTPCTSAQCSTFKKCMEIGPCFQKNDTKHVTRISMNQRLARESSGHKVGPKVCSTGFVCYHVWWNRTLRQKPFLLPRLQDCNAELITFDLREISGRLTIWQMETLSRLDSSNVKGLAKWSGCSHLAQNKSMITPGSRWAPAQRSIGWHPKNNKELLQQQELERYLLHFFSAVSCGMAHRCNPGALRQPGKAKELLVSTMLSLPEHIKKKRGLDRAPRPTCVVVLARCCCCNRLSTSFLPHSTQPFFCQSHLGKWALNNWKGKMVSQLRL